MLIWLSSCISGCRFAAAEDDDLLVFEFQSGGIRMRIFAWSLRVA
jgi:hypothetical protein